MPKFRIQENGRKIYKYAVDYIFNEIPKVHSLLRNKLEENLFLMNENIFRANINENNIRNKYQKEILVNISSIDMFLSFLRDKKLIPNKRFIAITNMLLEERKMVISWLNETNK